MSAPRHCRLLILGSGPAGYAAAVYAARANRKPVLLTGIEEGGQLMTTVEVDNWPGDPHGLTGPGLMERMRKHAERFNTEVVNDHINKVDLSQRPFHLEGDSGKYTCDALVIATGATAKYLGLAIRAALSRPRRLRVRHLRRLLLQESEGRSRSAAAILPSRKRCTCRTSRRTSRWSIGATRCARKRSCRITCSRSSTPARSAWCGTTTSRKCWVTRTASPVWRSLPSPAARCAQLDVTGVFIAVGHAPNTQLFEGQLEMKGGYLIVKAGLGGNATQTSVPGVFAAGDVADHVYRQAITSAGTGCMAALDADKYLDQLDAANKR